MKKVIPYISIATIAVATACVPALAQDAYVLERKDAVRGFSVRPEVDYTSGKFGGTQSTDVWSYGVTLRYERGPYAVRASIPYLQVSGPGNVVPAGQGVVQVCRQSNRGPGNDTGVRCTDDSSGGGAGSTTATRATVSGLGDVTAAFAYNAIDHRASGLLVDLTAKVKLPTADESRGLGTGRTDYALQIDADKPIGPWSVFGTAGYKWLGDPPGADLRNVFYGALGASYAMTDRATLGLAQDYRQATFAGGAALSETSVFASVRVAPSARLRGYVFKGHTSGGPDWGGGVSLRVGF